MNTTLIDHTLTDFVNIDSSRGIVKRDISGYFNLFSNECTIF